MSLLFEHVVVLMLENRSFDHLFGYLGVGAGLPPDGEVNYLKPGDAASPAFRTRLGGDFTSVGDGPAHSYAQINEQLFGHVHVPGDMPADKATLDGFVASFAAALKDRLGRLPVDSEIQQVMNCFDAAQLPVLSTLARSFVLCDHWFSDVPGPTVPNRAFVHAATSQGYTHNAHWKPAFNCKTLYDRINATPGASWRVYYHDHNDIPSLYPYVAMTPANNVLFDGNFLADVAQDRLATYSFVTPSFMGAHPNSMHAPKDVRPAEKLVADVYRALQAYEAVWQKTLLIVVFDEHGGYYDHVQPPATVAPDDLPVQPDGAAAVRFDFRRLGLRVPCILVSPWFPAGVDSTVYSHSSIPGSMIEAFGLGEFLTRRDAAAAKLTARYLTRSAAQVWRTDVPDLTAPVQPEAIDQTQRDILEAAVHLDPDPARRDVLRTQDLHDPAQAANFVRAQVAKHLEHRWTSGR